MKIKAYLSGLLNSDENWSSSSKLRQLKQTFSLVCSRFHIKGNIKMFFLIKKFHHHHHRSPINQSINQSINHSIYHSIIQLFNQSINQSINQSFNQSSSSSIIINHHPSIIIMTSNKMFWTWSSLSFHCQV